MNIADAQEVVKTVASPAGPQSAFMSLFVTTILPILALYYFFFVYLPSKDKKKRDTELNAIQRGDRVLTRGGIYGTVADIKEQLLILKISENTKIEVDRSYVENVQKPS
jgi:preprotein translocase subunit YajC